MPEEVKPRVTTVEAFSKFGTYPEIPGYVYVVFGLVLAILMAFYVLRKISQNKAEEIAEFNRFKVYAKECAIEDELWETLLSMVNTLQIKNPIQIIKNVETYDKYNSAFLKALLDKGLKAGDYEDVLLRLTKIRARLTAKAKEQFKPIQSTADLYSGLELQMEVKEGPFAGVYDTTLASANAYNMVVHSPNINGKKLTLDPGTIAHFKFSREDDAVYEFSTSTIGKYQGSLSAIVFQNTDQIQTSHVRKYIRVSPNFLIKILGIANPSGGVHIIESLKTEPVTILDISGGGMQLQVMPKGKLVNYLEKGKILVFSIYIPEIGPIEELKGKIVRTDHIKERSYIICSIEFHAINSKNRCRLLQGILNYLSKNK